MRNYLRITFPSLGVFHVVHIDHLESSTFPRIDTQTITHELLLDVGRVRGDVHYLRTVFLTLGVFEVMCIAYELFFFNIGRVRCDVHYLRTAFLTLGVFDVVTDQVGAVSAQEEHEYERGHGFGLLRRPDHVFARRRRRAARLQHRL